MSERTEIKNGGPVSIKVKTPEKAGSVRDVDIDLLQTKTPGAESSGGTTQQKSNRLVSPPLALIFLSNWATRFASHTISNPATRFASLCIAFTALLFTLVSFSPNRLMAQGFTTAKYGGDFVDAGAGARALGLGGAFTSLASDASAIYWNPAGLVDLDGPDLLLMHSERFSGAVGYDFIGFSLPLEKVVLIKATVANPTVTNAPAPNATTQGGESKTEVDRTPRVGIAVIRQGVDGIKNTLLAWDPDRGLPREDAESFITEFGVRDLAIYASYASRLTQTISIGASVKVIHHRVGEFADGWGYGLDAGARLNLGSWQAGVVITDLFPMLKFWEVDQQALKPLEEIYGDLLPTGQNERVNPTVRMGASTQFLIGPVLMRPAADVRLRFEGREAYSVNLGGMSIEPHLGLEATYAEVLSLRLGLTDLVVPPSGSATVTPAIGMGVRRRNVRIDYGFNNFSGYSSELGVTHRLSLGISLNARSTP